MSISIRSPKTEESTMVLVNNTSGYNTRRNSIDLEVKQNEYIESNLQDNWEFPRSKLTFGEELGHGAYGQVVKAQAINIQNKTGTTTVAVKRLKLNALDVERRSLMAELNMLKSLDKHVNVISLLGCCTTEGEYTFIVRIFLRKVILVYIQLPLFTTSDRKIVLVMPWCVPFTLNMHMPFIKDIILLLEPLLIIVEYASHGDLLKYLRSNRRDNSDFGKLSLERMLEVAWQVANGMTYLEQMKVLLLVSHQYL